MIWLVERICLQYERKLGPGHAQSIEFYVASRIWKYCKGIHCKKAISKVAFQCRLGLFSDTTSAVVIHGLPGITLLGLLGHESSWLEVLIPAKSH